MPECNSCGTESALAGEWGVCGDCFGEYMREVTEKYFDDDD